MFGLARKAKVGESVTVELSAEALRDNVRTFDDEIARIKKQIDECQQTATSAFGQGDSAAVSVALTKKQDHENKLKVVEADRKDVYARLMAAVADDLAGIEGAIADTAGRWHANHRTQIATIETAISEIMRAIEQLSREHVGWRNDQERINKQYAELLEKIAPIRPEREPNTTLTWPRSNMTDFLNRLATISFHLQQLSGPTNPGPLPVTMQYQPRQSQQAGLGSIIQGTRPI